MAIASAPLKYIVVKETILDSIRRELLPMKSRLAPIAKMSVHFGVSTSVIQRALNELANEGFIECRGASGYYVCDPQSGEESEKTNVKSQERTQSKIKPVFLTCSHHSDLVWRKTYEEADATRREQTERLIEIAERNPEFHFFFEQAETPVRLPEFHERLKVLVKSGQAEMIGGMCIPDLNMISGETFLRCLLRGRADYRKYFDVEPEIACLSDAFGMPLQVPQVLSLCGYKYLVPGRMPNAPESLDVNKPFCWKGANDTEVLVSAGIMLNDVAYMTNTPVLRDPVVQIKQSLEALAASMDYSVAVFCKEEGLFRENICRIVEQINRSGLREIHFATLQEYFERIAQEEHPCYIGEFNPVFTGCYTTRIGNKQGVRKAEILLRRAEVLAAAEGRELDNEDVEKELFRVTFHDSICGCCIDAGQMGIRKKLSGVLDYVQAQCTPVRKDKTSFFIANTSSVKGRQLVCADSAPAGIPSEKIGEQYYFYADLPAVGGKYFTIGTGDDSKKNVADRTIDTGSYSVDFNGKYPRFKGACNVFGDTFGAIRIRSDFGSMWTERYREAFLEDVCSQEDPYTVTEGALFYHASNSGRIAVTEANLVGHREYPWEGFESLTWKKDYYFPKGQDHFYLKITLDFHGNGTKVAAEFPHRLNPFELERTDSVPFGSLTRKPYYEVENMYEKTMKMLSPSVYQFAMGDWPVLDWNDFADQNHAFAIANNGTPGCWAAGDKIMFSLLRSGTAMEDGAVKPGPDSFDNGVHEYWFAFRIHEPGDLCKAAELGNILNRMPTESRPLPEGEWLSWDRENIALSCAEQKDGRLILRFYEFCGKRTQVRFTGSFVDGRTLLEIIPEGEELSIVKEQTVEFASNEIKTFVVTI
ncbi:MAG: GntR family transcriptional regulator [Lentisphaeria bacterium]|nr:GntR family transcriptional regulator [Lentisphaeria bacterium]